MNTCATAEDSAELVPVLPTGLAHDVLRRNWTLWQRLYPWVSSTAFHAFFLSLALTVTLVESPVSPITIETRDIETEVVIGRNVSFEGLLPDGTTIVTRQNAANSSEGLVRRLDTLSVDGVSLGGPHVGIGSNEVTDAIVAQGNPIVPELLAHLERANVSGAIYTVYCLRMLKAKQAREQVQALERSLQQGKRFASVQRDLTLEVQILFFLRDVDSW